MPTREEIRKVINEFLNEYDKDNGNLAVDWAFILSHRLADKGVVIKVDREPSTYLKENGEQKYYSDMPYEMYEDGWHKSEPLIKEE